jgi:hypothetical protein
MKYARFEKYVHKNLPCKHTLRTKQLFKVPIIICIKIAAEINVQVMLSTRWWVCIMIRLVLHNGVRIESAASSVGLLKLMVCPIIV